MMKYRQRNHHVRSRPLAARILTAYLRINSGSILRAIWCDFSIAFIVRPSIVVVVVVSGVIDSCCYNHKLCSKHFYLFFAVLRSRR